MGVSVTATFVLVYVLLRCSPGFGLTVDPLEAEPVDSEEKTQVDELSTAEPIDYGGNTEDTGPQTFGPPVRDDDYGDDDTGDGFEAGNGFETGGENGFETGNGNIDAFEPGNGNENDFEAENGDGNSFDAGNGNGDGFENGDGSGNGDEGEAGNEYGTETDGAGDDAAFEESNDLKKASSVEVNAHPVAGTVNGNRSDVSGNRLNVGESSISEKKNTSEYGNKTISNNNRNKTKSTFSRNKSRSNVSGKGNRQDPKGIKNDGLAVNGSNSANASENNGASGNKNRTSVIRNKRRNGSETRGQVIENRSKINETGSKMNVGGNKSESAATGSEPKNAYRTYENVNENRRSLNIDESTLSVNDTGNGIIDQSKLKKTGNDGRANGNEYWNGFKHYVTVNRTKSNPVRNETESGNKNGTKINHAGNETGSADGNENTGDASENSEVNASVVEVPSNVTSRSTETTGKTQKECGELTSGVCVETVNTPESPISGKPVELGANRTRVARRRSFMKTTGNNRDDTEIDVQKGESSKRSYNYDETQVPPPGSEIITYDYGEITEIIIPENPAPAPIKPTDTQRYGRQPDANSNPDPNYGYHQKPYFYDPPKTIPDMRYSPKTPPPQNPAPAYYHNPPDTNSSPYPTKSNFENHANNQNWDSSLEGYAHNSGPNSPHDYSSYSSTSQPNRNFNNQEKPGGRSEFKNHGSSLQFNKAVETYAPHHYDNTNPYFGPSAPDTRNGPSGKPSSYSSSGPDTRMGPSRGPPDFGTPGPDTRTPTSNFGPSGSDLNSEKNRYDSHQKSGPVYEYYGTPKSKTWVSYESIPIKNPSTDSGPPIVEIIYHRENGVVYEDDILDDFTTSSPMSSTSGDFPPSGDFPVSDFPPSHERPSSEFPSSGDFPSSGFPPSHDNSEKQRPSGGFPNSGNFPPPDNNHFGLDHGRPGKPRGEVKNTRLPSKNRGFIQKTTTSGPPRRRPGSDSRSKTKVTGSGSPATGPAENHFPHTDVDFDDEDFPESDFPQVPKVNDFPEKSKVKGSNPRQKNQKHNEFRRKEKLPKSGDHKHSGDDDFSSIKAFDENDNVFPKNPKITDFVSGKDKFSKKPKDTDFDDRDEDFNKKSKDTNLGTEDDNFSKKVKNTKFEAGDDGFTKTSKDTDFDTDDGEFTKDLDDTDFRNLKEQIDGTPVKGPITDFPDEWQKTKTTNSATKKQKSEKPINEKHKSEKGEKHDSVHKKSEGKKGEKGSKTEKQYSEGEKGHAEEGKQSEGSAKKGGKKKAGKDEGGYYAEKHKGEEGEKKGEFQDKEKHHKGHSTKGKHEIHKKDEFSRKHSFYDEHHEGGKHEKHGGYKKAKKIEKGEESHKGGSGEGYEDEHNGKEGKFKKGKRYKGDKGGEEAQGKDGMFLHKEEYGKKGAEEKKEEKEFEL